MKKKEKNNFFKFSTEKVDQKSGIIWQKSDENLVKSSKNLAKSYASCHLHATCRSKILQKSARFLKKRQTFDEIWHCRALRSDAPYKISQILAKIGQMSCLAKFGRINIWRFLA